MDGLYDDLENFDFSKNLQSLQERNEKLEFAVRKLVVQIRTLSTTNKELMKKNAALETNISSLYKTAKAEICRKDKRINSLGKEMDEFIMRYHTKRQSLDNNTQPLTSGNSSNKSNKELSDNLKHCIKSESDNLEYDKNSDDQRELKYSESKDFQDLHNVRRNSEGDPEISTSNDSNSTHKSRFNALETLIKREVLEYSEYRKYHKEPFSNDRKNSHNISYSSKSRENSSREISRKRKSPHYESTRSHRNSHFSDSNTRHRNEKSYEIRSSSIKKPRSEYPSDRERFRKSESSRRSESSKRKSPKRSESSK